VDISTAGRSLSQVLDQLGSQVNGALTLEFGSLAEPTPEVYGGRVAGENAIIFRNASDVNQISLTGTDSLLDANGIDAVIQNVAFNVPALSSTTYNWNTADEPAVTFNGDGSIDTFFGLDETAANDPKSQVKIGWANGALDMDGTNTGSGLSSAITQFWGNYNESDGLQQLSGEYQLNYISQDGNRFGNYAGLTVSENGVVTALFDNGVQTPIFMIPVATFVNPNGMNPLTGNVFQQTDTSGLPVVREAGSAGAATVAQATLEASTVDLGEEFTTMITTQRAYSAAAKIITTSDDMLEELIRIKR
jgi:flagellar hook protein FlgE